MSAPDDDLALADPSEEDRADPVQLAADEAQAWEALASEAEDVRDGHPALMSALRWRDFLLDEGLREPAVEAEELALNLITSEAREEIEEGLEGDTPATFGGLLAALRGSREVLITRRTGGGRVPFTDEIEKLRARLADQQREAPLDRSTRREFADALIDVADESLAASYEQESRLAAELLDQVRSALAFHLDVVEKGGSPERRRLAWRQARTRAERQERLLQARLEARFGERWVGRWERLILVAILVVIALMLVPLFLEGELRDRTLFGFNALHVVVLIDTLCCVLFLWDFLVKAVMVQWNGAWLRRHIVPDLLPALPVGLLQLGGAEKLGSVKGAGVAFRMLRLGRVLHYLRLAAPLVRAVQGLSFLVRGVDRLARRLGPRIDRDLVVFPTPMERTVARRRRRMRGRVSAAWSRVADLDDRWEEALREGAADEVHRARLGVLEQAKLVRPNPDSQRQRSQGLLLEPSLERWAEASTEEIAGELGPELSARVARGARSVGRSPLRHLPLLRGAFDPPAPDEEDGSVAARAVRGMARQGLSLYRRALAFADLSTTVTPAETVGRVGATLVKRTARPASRLLLFGLLFAVLQGLVWLLNIDMIQGWAEAIQKATGTALVVLGSVCFVLLGLGLWMQRLAKDASTLFDQIAGAQFANLTDSIRVRRIEADAELLEQRVFAPERRLAGAEPLDAPAIDRAALIDGVRGWMLEGQSPVPRARVDDPLPKVVLLYRDLLDGAPLTEQDTRASGQLLGNVALRRLRERAGIIGKPEEKALTLTDLARKRSLLGGPYMWFQLVSQAMVHGAARLILDYNDHAIPLEDREVARADELERFQRWLETRSAGELPEGRPLDRHGQLTTSFSLLHVLDDDERRDEEVGARFGPEVLERLQADRRRLFRRVFGTAPLHRRPREKRVINPRELHRRWPRGWAGVPAPAAAPVARLPVQHRDAQGVRARGGRDPRSRPLPEASR